MSVALALVAVGPAVTNAGAATAGSQAAAPVPPDPENSAAAVADNLVKGPAGVLALHRGPLDTLVRKGVALGGNGLHYVSYERAYKDLPVVGGDAVVVTDAQDSVVAVTAAQDRPILSVDTVASVTAAAASKASQAGFSTVESVSTPRLVVLAWGTPTLTWETVVEGVAAERPSKLHVFVDAIKGDIKDSYDEVRDVDGAGKGFYEGPVTFVTSGSGSAFTMTDATRPGLRCGGQNATAYTSADNDWGNATGTSLETACVDAMFVAQKEWDMLSSWLGRNGFSGSGGAFPIRVGLAEVNAFWNGTYANFGHSQDNKRQATAADVVAHELGHAIFQHTAGGAGSGNENGGINEATGDIFGAMTEAYINSPVDPPDFIVGEAVDLGGGGPIRYMYDPSLRGHPNCYSTAIQSTEVHAAAGPLNHWFYLLAKGSGATPASPICSGGPGSVTGIGLQNAGKIYYNAMLAKTSTWRYADVRVATLNAAKNLFPGSCTQFNTVRDAWNAVTVQAAGNEPTCTGSANDFSIAISPSSGTVAAGASTTVTVSTATVNGSAQAVALTATSLPTGVTASFSPPSVNSGGTSTLTISTSKTTPSGTHAITVTGKGAASHTTAYTITVTGGSSGGDCNSPGQKLGNPDFEAGTTPWTGNTTAIGAFVGQDPRGGTRFAWLDGYGVKRTETLAQTVALPSGCSSYGLSMWLHIETDETVATRAFDTLKVQVLDAGGAVLTTLATYSNMNKANGYSQKSFSLSPYAGQTIQIKFTGAEDAGLRTSFVIDDVAVKVS